MSAARTLELETQGDLTLESTALLAERKLITHFWYTRTRMVLLRTSRNRYNLVQEWLVLHCFGNVEDVIEKR